MHPINIAYFDDVFRENTSSQPELGIIGSLHHLIQRGEASNGHHRAEYLLPHDGHIILHIREHGGLHVVSLGAVCVETR